MPRLADFMKRVDEIVQEDQRDHDLDGYVLYAQEKVKLRRIADSQGHVGSNQRIAILWGRSGILEGNLTALERIRVRGSITVEGDVVTNGDIHVHKRGNLDVTGTTSAGEEGVLSSIDLSPLSEFTAGEHHVWVWRRGQKDLVKGSYGTVRLFRGATLHLSTGEYYMKDLCVGHGATVSVDASNGPVTINVVDRFYMGWRSAIAIEGGSTSDVTINVLGGCRAVWIGGGAEIRGTLVAPNSRVWLGYRSPLEGAAYARRIYAGSHAHFEPHK